MRRVIAFGFALAANLGATAVALAMMAGLAFASEKEANKAAKEPRSIVKTDSKAPPEAKKAKDEKTIDVESAFSDGQKAVADAIAREKAFQSLCAEFAKSIEKAPREPLNIAEEKMAFDRLDKIISMLTEDCELVIRQFPKFDAEAQTLLAAYDSSIAALVQSESICAADAKNEKDASRKEDFLVLSRISLKAAENFRTRAKEATIRRTEVAKLVAECEKDRLYFARAAAVIQLVKSPLQREQVQDDFLKRILRFQKARSEFKKIMRDWSDLEQTPKTPPIKIGTGNVMKGETAKGPNAWPVILVEGGKGLIRSAGTELRSKTLVIRRGSMMLIGTATVELVFNDMAVIHLSETQLRIGDVASTS
jgi:hypothetical protein